MPIVYVDYRNIGNLPDQLEYHLSAEKWNRIRNEIYSIVNNNTLFACAIEWGVCCLTGLFCVFCAHPCIDTALAEQRINDALVRLNRELFECQPVLSRQGPNISINTENIPPPKSVVIDSTGKATFVHPSAQVIYVSSIQPMEVTTNHTSPSSNVLPPPPPFVIDSAPPMQPSTV